MHEKQLDNNVNLQDKQENLEKLSPEEFKNVIEQYGLTGSSPEERANSLKKMSPESLALLITDINRRLQGSSETLVHEQTMKVGEESVVPIEYRYDLFMSLTKKISESDANTNPERIGDALSLGLVILHPFKDGNGRTSRIFRLVFDESFDSSDFENNFNFLSESRDESRERGGNIAIGYIPYFAEGQKQDDPEAVEDYFHRLLNEENPHLYTGPALYAELKKKELVTG